MFSRKATNTNLMVSGMALSGIEPQPISTEHRPLTIMLTQSVGPVWDRHKNDYYIK